MNSHMTRDARAEALQRALLAGFNFVTVTPVKGGQKYRIEMTGGMEKTIRKQADAFLGMGNYTLEKPKVLVG